MPINATLAESCKRASLKSLKYKYRLRNRIKRRLYAGTDLRPNRIFRKILRTTSRLIINAPVHHA